MAGNNADFVALGTFAADWVVYEGEGEATIARHSDVEFIWLGYDRAPLLALLHALTHYAADVHQ